MRGSGLRSRLFWGIGVVVLVSVALTIGLGLVFTRRAVDRATLHDVSHQADLLAASVRSGVGTLRNLQPRFEAILNEQHEFTLHHKTDLPEWAQRRLAHHQPAEGTMNFGGAPYYFAARSVNPGTLILLRPKNTDLSPYVWGLLIAAAAGVVLAALAAFLLARRISRPVDRVAAAARTLTRGTHPEPVPVEGAAEIATLAVAFNELAAQLRQAQEAERNFLLSVSHELKTPLTAIRGYAEAVEDGVVDPREAAATVAAEAGRLERLVRDLLDLARMNRTDFSVHNSEIDLAEVAADAVRRYEQQAESFGVELHAVADGAAPAIADADRVLQVVSNLVENALRLTPPGGEERQVGTGLGLAIVKELTLAMDGDVDVESRPGELTVFTVRLRVPKVAARATLPA
jgi:signal transduction histidine kinase